MFIWPTNRTSMWLMDASRSQQSMLRAIPSQLHAIVKSYYRVLTLFSAGLAPTGASDGDCSTNTGQIYVRGTSYGDYYALMYSWYV